MLEVSCCRGTWLNPCGGRCEHPWRGHSLTVINLTRLWEAFCRRFETILSHFARRARSWVWQRLCRHATQRAVTGLSLSTVTEDSGPAVLLSVRRSRKIPACSILPYLELHYHNRWSHTELYIWSTASSPLVIIFVGGSVAHLVILRDNTRDNNLVKQAKYNNTASSILKSQVRIKPGISIRCSPVYPQAIWHSTALYLSGILASGSQPSFLVLLGWLSLV